MFLLQEVGRPLLDWSDVVRELIGFVAVFLMLGAAGFYYAVLRPASHDLRVAPWGAAEGAQGIRSAFASAARFGMLGALLEIIAILLTVASLASARHLTFGAAASRAGTALIIQVVLVVLALVGYAMAARRVGGGWLLAAIAAFAFQLRPITSLKWTQMVNPLHEMFGALWIGTLFVLVAAALPIVLRGSVPRQERGPTVAALIARFSNLALVAAGLLAVTGIITAWRHLHVWSSLWTTPYGWTLIVKLCFVALVLALGAFNFRRMRPRLGTEEAAHAIRRSSTTELSFAGVVLIITAILVSLPSPRRPGAGPRPGGAGTPAAGAAPAGTPAAGAPAAP